jgi:hypothetical protein
VQRCVERALQQVPLLVIAALVRVVLVRESPEGRVDIVARGGSLDLEH